MFLFFVSSAFALSFNVNSTQDTKDAHPGDGICETAAFNCTLRAAIGEANAFPGTDTILLQSATYVITLAGGGDFDISDSVIIQGIHPNTTIIDGDDIDRLFDMNEPLSCKYVYWFISK